jgi:hypothetical protein
MTKSPSRKLLEVFVFITPQVIRIPWHWHSRKWVARVVVCRPRRGMRIFVIIMIKLEAKNRKEIKGRGIHAHLFVPARAPFISSVSCFQNKHKLVRNFKVSNLGTEFFSLPLLSCSGRTSLENGGFLQCSNTNCQRRQKTCWYNRHGRGKKENECTHLSFPSRKIQIQYHRLAWQYHSLCPRQIYWQCE